MASTRQSGRKASQDVVIIDPEPTAEPLPIATDSKIPSVLRFPIVTLISLATSLALRTISSAFSLGDLATISTQRDEWVDVTAFVGWKVADLAVAWWLGYDGKGMIVFL